MALKVGEWFEKRPGATVPIVVDWTGYLASLAADETISASAWAVTPSGLTTSSPSIVTGSLKAQVRLSKGTPGGRYTLRHTITTSSGVIDYIDVPVLILPN